MFISLRKLGQNRSLIHFINFEFLKTKKQNNQIFIQKFIHSIIQSFSHFMNFTNFETL
jgi:hypothetical protein